MTPTHKGTRTDSAARVVGGAVGVSAVILAVEHFGGWTLPRNLVLTVYAVILCELSIELFVRAHHQSGLARTLNRLLAIGVAGAVAVMVLWS